MSKLRIPQLVKHATGQAVVRIGGKDYYCGKYGTANARKRYQELLAQHLVGDLESPSAPEKTTDGLTIVEVIASYWDHVEAYYVKDGRPTSEVHIARRVLRSLKENFGATLANDFGPLRLKAFRNILLDQGSLSRSSINKYIARVVQMFKWAVEHELVPPDRYQGLRAVSGLRAGRTAAREAEPVTPVDDATVEQTLPHLPSVVVDMVRLQRLTGMRPAEVCLLRPMDVDRSEGVWRYVPSSHKTEHHGKRRVIFIGPQGQAVLRPYLLRPADQYCFSARDSEAKRLAERHEARTTPSGHGNSPGTNRKAKPKRRAGERYTSNSYRRAVHRACDKAKVSQWSPNQLRHSMATQIRKHFDIEHVSSVLGHANIDISELYALQDERRAQIVVQQLG
jgi:integrase